jgi:hypothetical protein
MLSIYRFFTDSRPRPVTADEHARYLEPANIL